MPLKMVECVLSWLAEDLGEEEAQFFIQNIQLAGLKEIIHYLVGIIYATLVEK